MTLSTALSTEDRLAILELYAQYSHSVDSGDEEGFAACFTPDGTFTIAPDTTTRGSEQLKATPRNFKARMKAAERHWNNNIILEASDGGARGSCYVMVMRSPSDGEPAKIRVTGVYEDRLVKSGDGWRFSARKFTADR